jgi:hypothetical protein
MSEIRGRSPRFVAQLARAVMPDVPYDVLKHHRHCPETRTKHVSGFHGAGCSNAAETSTVFLPKPRWSGRTIPDALHILHF